MILNAFSPNSQTVVQTPGAASAQVALNVVIGVNNEQLRVVNRSTQDLFLAFGFSSSVTAVVPIVGTPAASHIVMAGEDAIFTPPAGTSNVAMIQASAGTGNAYFTSGQGL